MKKTFVTVATGNHVKRIPFLRKAFAKYCKNSELIVLEDPIEENCVFRSRELKTGFYKYVDASVGLCCFIDTDVIPVSYDFENIFDEYCPPVTFRNDGNKTVDSFSKYACKKGRLSENIKSEFGIDVDSDWNIWNGGCFLIDLQNKVSKEFMVEWYTSLTDNWNTGLWKQRDQGFLISSAWKMRLQNQPRFPKEYCWLHKLDSGLRYNQDNEEFFNKNSKISVKSIHFCLTYGRESSITWDKTKNLVFNDEKF